MADNEASTQSPPDSAGGSLVTQADADAGEMSSGQMNTGESTAAINPAIQRITSLTPMRTDSLEKLRVRMNDSEGVRLTRTDSLRDSSENILGYASDQKRFKHLLKAAFLAWSPRGRLSTTALIKASIARIFLRKERATSGAPGEGRSIKSVKLRGLMPPESLIPVAGQQVDALDAHFKWYPSEVLRVSTKAGAALIQFADLPDRFNAWIPFNSGRLAELGAMTSDQVCDQACKSTMRCCGTTALIEEGIEVDIYSRAKKFWARATVTGVSEDGEEVDVKMHDPNVLDQEDAHVVVDDGCIRMHIDVPEPKHRGHHRRSLSLGAELAPVNFTTLKVDINTGRRKALGYGEEWVEFEVHDRYSEPVFLGKGAYGCVISADDSVIHDKVAIKKISGIRDMDHIDSMRTLREMKICRHLRNHDNIVKLINVIPQRAEGPTDELYLIFEYMPSDLSKFIRSGELSMLPLEEQQTLTKGYMYQMLCALKYIHSAGIMHRDIKPSNILVSKQGDLKLADFGLAIGAAGTSHKMISYVVTRWYRAPELLLDLNNYDAAIDLWALGCIFAEMFSMKPRFPGKSSRHQLQLILQILGKPLDEDVPCMSNPKFYDLLRAMEPRDKMPWKRLYPKQSDDEIHLLDKLLELNPQKRLSVDEALQHPYFNDWRTPLSSHHDEHDCEELFGFVTEDLSTDEIDKMLKEEVGVAFEKA